MLIIAAAAPFGWVLTQQQIPNAVIASLFALASEPWMILIIVICIASGAPGNRPDHPATHAAGRSRAHIKRCRIRPLFRRDDTLRFDKAYWYACVPVCGALMTVYTLAGLVRVARGEDEETITDSMD